MTWGEMGFPPDRLKSEIVDHLYLNFVDSPGQPLMLGVFGPPGEGKTYNLRGILKGLHVRTFSVNAADLESELAGDPGKQLLEIYRDASACITSGEPCAIVVDDIDTTVGEWKNYTGTVNHQQVLAQLMHFADRPDDTGQSFPGRRVPIFVTGNDFGKLYSPLKRPGRMSLLFWKLTPDEKLALAQSILRNVAPETLIRKVFWQHQQQPVAFFSALNARLLSIIAQPVIRNSEQSLNLVTQNPARHREYLLAARQETEPLRAEVVKTEASRLARESKKARKSYLHPRFFPRSRV